METQHTFVPPTIENTPMRLCFSSERGNAKARAHFRPCNGTRGAPSVEDPRLFTRCFGPSTMLVACTCPRQRYGPSCVGSTIQVSTVFGILVIRNIRVQVGERPVFRNMWRPVYGKHSGAIVGNNAIVKWVHCSPWFGSYCVRGCHRIVIERRGV